MDLAAVKMEDSILTTTDSYLELEGDWGVIGVMADSVHQAKPGALLGGFRSLAANLKSLGSY